MVPKMDPNWLKWCKRYARWYVARQFHAVRLSRAGGVPALRGPTVFVVDITRVGGIHSRCCWSAICFPTGDTSRRWMQRLWTSTGCLYEARHVWRETRTGRASVPAPASAILAQPVSVLWVTGQGRFADVRGFPPASAAACGGRCGVRMYSGCHRIHLLAPAFPGSAGAFRSTE